MACEVGSMSSFRLGISFSAEQGGSNPLPSPSLAGNRSFAPFTKVTTPHGTGVKTSFGSLVADNTGVWTLSDAAGKVVVSADGPATLDPAETGTITSKVRGASGTGPGAAGPPCLSNGGFAPPYTWDPVAQFFAFAVSPWNYDPDAIHCYPHSFGPSKLSTGGVDLLALAEGADTCTPTQPADVEGYVRSPSARDGLLVNASDSVRGCCSACNAHSKDCTAWVTTKDGKPDGSGKNCWLMSSVSKFAKSSDRISGGKAVPPPPPPPPAPPGWHGRGVSMDYYLAPAEGGYDYIKALYDLTGAPAVPPRHGMAFMATYWGYTSMAEVEGYMHRFRNGSYPIDSFIMDYDWFGPNSCGPAGANGGLTCGDFGYKGAFFSNQTFSKLDGTKVFAAGPKDVLAHFHGNMKMRFAGIRKPRTYSNINFTKQQGWMLDPKSSVGAGGNNWNYSSQAMRDWYAANHLHFLEDGIDYWWNDEGETEWFTYLWWNMAQQQQWDQAKPNQRHFTINRAFQPGMQRFPAVTWSGDGQDCSHAMIIRFTMYGQLYTACDMTSPDATVLVRQYQNAVFMPIMRVHQMHGTPRFPFLWGGAEHQVAFRDALNMRYTFLPFLYSLAHHGHRHGRPIGHPASFEFPGDMMPGTTGDETYMVGGVLVPADVSTSHNTQGENATTVNLPPGKAWYRWNTTASEAGNQTIAHTDVGLADMIVYVREGAILPLQASTIQYSDQAGGMLHVQVYAGADGSFEMVEDDGTTLDYTADDDKSAAAGNEGGVAGHRAGSSATKTTNWTWVDATKTLSYTVLGTFSGPNAYTSVQAVLFEAASAAPQYAAAQPLANTGGSIAFK